MRRSGPIRARRPAPRRTAAPADELAWPVEFAPHVRTAIIARDTPQGMGGPLCWVCGRVIDARRVEIHHCRYRSRGGLGNPANGISLHDQFTDPACHVPRCHDNNHADGQADAVIAGWAISRHAAPAACYEPRWHAVRGWVVLDDDGGWRPAKPDEITGYPRWRLVRPA